MAGLFFTVVKMSGYGAVAALAVELLLALFWRARVSKTALLSLWLLVGFRLVCPWSPSSPVSLFNWEAVSHKARQFILNVGMDKYQAAAGFSGRPDENDERAVMTGVKPVQNGHSSNMPFFFYREDAGGAITAARTVT